jgi:hypothetical protein
LLLCQLLFGSFEFLFLIYFFVSRLVSFCNRCLASFAFLVLCNFDSILSYFVNCSPFVRFPLFFDAVLFWFLLLL